MNTRNHGVASRRPDLLRSGRSRSRSRSFVDPSPRCLRFRLLLVAALFPLFFSCGGVEAELASLSSKGTPIADAIERASLEPEALNALKTAERVIAFAGNEFGIASPVPGFVVLESPESALAWRASVVKADSYEVVERRVFANEESAGAFVSEVRARGDAAFVERLESIRDLTRAPTPFTAARLRSPYEDLVEWTVREMIGAIVAKRADRDKLAGFTEFVAEQVTLAYLRATLSPESPVISRYISTRRDSRTFATLLQDYRARFANLYATEKDPARRSKSRELLSRAWLVDFRDQYPNRFLTNDWLAFASAPWDDARLASWVDPWPKWKDWERELQSRSGDLRRLIEDFVGANGNR